MTNVKGVARSEAPAENRHQTLQLPSALQSVSGLFRRTVVILRPTTQHGFQQQHNT